MEERQLDYITDRRDCELMQIWQSYKASKQGHNYLPLYHRHLHEMRHQVRQVLEIGVHSAESVQLWAHFFPNAQIHGLDIDPRCKQFEQGPIKIYIGDQGDQRVLSGLPRDLDIIIDDGSHFEEHQIGTFKYLFEHNMRPRGMYVIEDTENRPKTNQFFAELIPKINYWPQGLDGAKWPTLNSFETYNNDYLVRNVIGVSFYRYLIFVDKGANPQDGEAAARLRGEV